MSKVKIMMAIARKKDNDKINTESEQKAIKRIFTDNNRNFVKRELESIIAGFPEYEWRLYETINYRDTEKAWFILQGKIANWQLYGDNFGWTEDLHNKWLGVLMKPESRGSKAIFLLDVDDKSIITEFREFLKINVIPIIDEYPTLNGHHFLVDAFDSRMLKDTNFVDKVEIIRDGLRYAK